jgi:DNA polymerase-3 subunit epsilon
MRLLGLDFEATDKTPDTARITEMGVVLWETDGNRPLVTVGTFLYDKQTYGPLSEEVKRITGITDEMLEEFGTLPGPNLQWLDSFCKGHRVDYIVAHNGGNFDRPLLYAELDRLALACPQLRTLPWLDTLSDIPFASEPDSRKLKYLAGDHGFLNPFAHRAVFDVLTMMKVLSHYDIQKVIEYSKIPVLTIRAVVSFDQKELAKERKYRWENLGDRKYPKCWVKEIRENKLEEEIANSPFKVVVLKDA